jgi:Putative Ig domain/Bacterial Ig domain
MNEKIYGYARSVSFAVLSLLVAQTALADTVNVAWDPNPDTVSGYAVYVGQTSGNYSQRFDVGASTMFSYSSAVAGQLYCFAVAAYSTVGESPKSSEVCGFSNRAPLLSNPGNQSSTVGQSIALQLIGSDPDGQAVTYSATGLPPGLSVGPSTGFISGTGTTSGTFSVTARDSDGVLSASQSFTWSMAAAPAPAPTPTPDTTAPTVSIVTPTSGSTFTSATSAIGLSGSGSDNVGVTQVSWVNDRGGAGFATGTTSWSVGSIALQGGTNTITVRATDAAGNVGTDVLSVTYTPPVASSAVVLTAQVSSMKFKRNVALSWTSAPWSGAMVYRNDARLTKTLNDGSYTDQLRSAGSYTYKVCDANSTVCTNTVTVYY